MIDYLYVVSWPKTFSMYKMLFLVCINDSLINDKSLLRIKTNYVAFAREDTVHLNRVFWPATRLL